MSVKRIDVSKLKLVENEDIIGNDTSVMNKYIISENGKTGFYKKNGCTLYAKREEDLRELFSTKIMDVIGFKHADILLACDGENSKGCISVNILGENEEFVIPKAGDKRYETWENGEEVKGHIERDLRLNSKIPGITSKDLKLRKEYLINHLLVSAITTNTDEKLDNMLMIRNNVTGEFRNPEYYDMGAAFIENDDRNFFYKLSSSEVIEQLYYEYPSQVVPFARKIQERLNMTTVEQLLEQEDFDEFSKETKDTIKSQLSERIEQITQLNSREENKFRFGIDSLHELAKNTSLELRDRVSRGIGKLKDKLRGKENDI